MLRIFLYLNANVCALKLSLLYRNVYQFVFFPAMLRMLQIYPFMERAFIEFSPCKIIFLYCVLNLS